MADITTEYMDGWCAHKEGCISGSNPYDDLTQAFSCRRWLSGWCARFEAIKHGSPLDLDEAYD